MGQLKKRKKKIVWIGPQSLGRYRASGARATRLDGHGRKRRPLFRLIDWMKHTHTHTRKHIKRKHKPLPKKSHNGHKTAWDRYGFYSPPGANLVPLACLFGVSLSKHSPLGFSFSFFLFFLVFFSHSWDGFFYGHSHFFDIQLHWADTHQPLSRKRRSFLLGKWTWGTICWSHPSMRVMMAAGHGITASPVAPRRSARNLDFLLYHRMRITPNMALMMAGPRPIRPPSRGLSEGGQASLGRI